MDLSRIHNMSFAGVYPHYLAKVEKKGRSKAELHELITWLSGYNDQELEKVMANKLSFRQMFENAPAYHPNANKITGVICGCRVEEIEDPVYRFVRQLDKIVDELAKGRAIDKILRK